ncbi:MAG: NifU family protein [Saprospiraceae bacterium]
MEKEEKDKILARIDAALDDVRPHLEADGGNVELLDLTDDLCVKIKWLGNCENCFMSVMTMKAGIEQAIKAKVPEVQSIEAINGMEMPL